MRGELHTVRTVLLAEVLLDVQPHAFHRLRVDGGIIRIDKVLAVVHSIMAVVDPDRIVGHNEKVPRKDRFCPLPA